MRKDPPFDMEYVYSTYILERAQDQGALVVNRPRGLRDMNEKVYTAWFPQCCAPTLITRDMGDMAAFLASRARSSASRSMAWAAARSSSSITTTRTRRVIFETLSDYGERFVIVQRYLPEIAVSGDARMLLIEGEPVPVRPRPHSLLPTDIAAISPPAPRASAGARRARPLARPADRTELRARRECSSWAWM